MMACLGLGKSKAKNPVLPFSTVVLKVNPTGPWEATVGKVLKKIKEVSSFKMYDDGHMQISGTLNPPLLLKVLAKSGKAAEVVHFNFGGCSVNLHMPEFEIYQQFKQYDKYLVEREALYNSLYMKGDGQERRNYDHNYEDGRIYSNVRYLPPGQHHPYVLPAHGYPRY